MYTNITLIGFQASGKTTLGKFVAERLQRPFIDTDLLIEQAHVPLSCAQIYKMYGETYFRSLESQLLHQVSRHQNSVIAIGGGCLLLEANVLSLKKHSLLIYLKTPQEVIKERIWSRNSLPAYLDTDNPDTSFNTIFNQRLPLFEHYADRTIDMQKFSFEQAIDEIVNLKNV